MAGSATGLLVDNLPKQSTVLVYGALSDRFSENINPIELIFASKHVRGFYLGEWLQKRGFIERCVL